jgi:triosephosphate isomerase
MAAFHLTGQNFDIYDGDGLDPFARTGATSVEQLYKAGAEGVILGHSEVGDAPEVVKKKLATTVKRSEGNPEFLSRLTLLVGESWEEFDGKTPEEVAQLVTEQLMFIIDGVPLTVIDRLVVGYEPKWGSRGSGRDDMPPPSPALVSQVAKSIHESLIGKYGVAGEAIPIIYGGRSTPERTLEILSDENVEGLILGSACNTVAKTMDIATSMAAARPGKRKILHANWKAYVLPDSYEEYVRQLSALDDTFIVYLSPAATDIRALKGILSK